MASRIDEWLNTTRQQFETDILSAFKDTAHHDQISKVLDKWLETYRSDVPTRLQSRWRGRTDADLSELSLNTLASIQDGALVLKTDVTDALTVLHGHVVWASFDKVQINLSPDELFAGISTTDQGRATVFTLPDSRKGVTVKELLRVHLNSTFVFQLSPTPGRKVVTNFRSLEADEYSDDSGGRAGFPLNLLQDENVATEAKAEWVKGLGTSGAAVASMSKAAESLKGAIEQLCEGPLGGSHFGRPREFALRLGSAMRHTNTGGLLVHPAWTISELGERLPIMTSAQAPWEPEYGPDRGAALAEAVVLIPSGSPSPSVLSEQPGQVGSASDTVGPHPTAGKERSIRLTPGQRSVFPIRKIGLRYKKELADDNRKYRLSGNVEIMSSADLRSEQAAREADGFRLVDTRSSEDDIHCTEEINLGDYIHDVRKARHALLKTVPLAQHPGLISLPCQVSDPPSAQTLVTQWKELWQQETPPWQTARYWGHWRLSGDERHYYDQVGEATERVTDSLQRYLSESLKRGESLDTGTILVPGVCLFQEGARRSVLVHTWALYGKGNDQPIARSIDDKDHQPTLLRRNRHERKTASRSGSQSRSAARKSLKRLPSYLRG
jgi:hypothetical protein